MDFCDGSQGAAVIGFALLVERQRLEANGVTLDILTQYPNRPVAFYSRYMDYWRREWNEEPVYVSWPEVQP